MEIQKILSHCDHTLLSQTARESDIYAVLDDAIRYGTASACIPPSYVKAAKKYAGDRVAVCTVIGFPNGYNTSAVKAFEAREAVKEGADEIDMVINLGWVKDKKWDALLDEIRLVKEACGGKLLKVIIETCFLTDEEKVKLCEIVTESGADFIKTSTGFGGAGATFADIRLFSEHIGPDVRMKAAGGISSLADAEEFLRLGAERLGTSRVVKLAKAMEQEEFK